VWLADAPAIAALLEADGWGHAPLEDEDGGTGYERQGVRLELTFVVRDEQGRPAVPLRSGAAAWPEGALGGDSGELEGVSARLVSREALTAGKESPRDDPDDAAKDLADFAVLSRFPGRRSIRRA
jgi:hypothetical protein